MASHKLGSTVPAQIRSQDGYLIFNGGRGSLAILDGEWREIKHELVTHASPIVDLQMTSSVAFTGASDGLIRSWDLQSGQKLQETPTRYSIVRAIAPGQGVVASLSTSATHTAIEVSG